MPTIVSHLSLIHRLILSFTPVLPDLCFFFPKNPIHSLTPLIELDRGIRPQGESSTSLLYGKLSQVEYAISPVLIVSNKPSTNTIWNLQLLMLLDPPTLKDRSLRKKDGKFPPSSPHPKTPIIPISPLPSSLLTTIPARRLAAKFAGKFFHPLLTSNKTPKPLLTPSKPGATPKTINKRVIQLRREIKQINIPLTAPGQIEEPRTPSTKAAAAADANKRNLPPPGAPTPTFPRGPRSPKPFRSPITGKWFAIAAAPKSHKQMRRNGAPTRLRWNIHDDYAWEHCEMKRAAMRAEVLDDIAIGRDIIDLVSPASFSDSGTAATTSTWDRP